MKILFLVMIIPVMFQSGFTYADPILAGSFASQVRQNQIADSDGLERIANDSQLFALKNQKQLVPIPRVAGVRIDPRVKKKLQVVRPWTAQFLKDLGSEFHAKFGESFRVNSATRTVVHQAQLAKKNRNAAATEGERRSSHLTGATIDIGKKRLTARQIQWMRGKLVELEQEGLIEATEEHYQAVFHVMVFKKYEQRVLVAVQ